MKALTWHVRATCAAAPFAIITGVSTGLGLSAGVLVVLVAFWFVVPQLARHARQLDAESPRQPGLR